MLHPLKLLIKNTVALSPEQYRIVCIQLQDNNSTTTKIVKSFFQYYKRCQRLTYIEEQHNDLKEEYLLLKFRQRKL